MFAQISKILFITMAISACTPPDSHFEDQIRLSVPEGFDPIPVPAHNPLTRDKILLGQQLFFDPLLSMDSTVSCATCHQPNTFFADAEQISQGVGGRFGMRNTPSLINIAYHQLFFWDGGSITLEHQVFGPLQNPDEMGLDLASVLQRLASIPIYEEAFENIYGEPPSLRGLTQALGAYQRTLLSGGSRYDRYKAGDVMALTPAEKRGHHLFEGKAGCIHCHSGFLLTNLMFKNNGLFITQEDSGRVRVTGLGEDYGKFKVPSLRNVAQTAPYMHDGRMATISDVIDHYNKGGNGVRGQSSLIQPLNLEEDEEADLITFLSSLTDTTVFAGIESP